MVGAFEGGARDPSDAPFVGASFEDLLDSEFVLFAQRLRAGLREHRLALRGGYEGTKSTAASGVRIGLEGENSSKAEASESSCVVPLPHSVCDFESPVSCPSFSIHPKDLSCSGAVHPKEFLRSEVTAEAGRTGTVLELTKRVITESVDATKDLFSSREAVGQEAATNVFGDLIRLKESSTLTFKKYDTKEKYNDSGCWQRVTRTHAFENMSVGVIIFNALWLAVDTDNNTADSLIDADAVFQVVEHFFCSWFFVEWLFRFMSFKLTRDALRDPWFVFDTLLVFMIVLETWLLSAVMLATNSRASLGDVSIFKLFRLSRLTRISRMIRFMPELLILIQGMVAAMRSVAFVMLLLFMLNYVFSIAFVQLLRGEASGLLYFPNIPASMYTLLLAGTFMDNITRVADAIALDSKLCGFLFFVFVGVAALTMMNMLIGVLCEVVTSVAQREKEKTSIQHFHQRFHEIWTRLDEDGSGTLTKQEFALIMTDNAVWETLQQIDIDPIVVLKLADQIFCVDQDTGEEAQLSLEEFMEAILHLRASNTATVKDLHDLRGWMDDQLHRQREAMRRQHSHFMGVMPVDTLPGQAGLIST